MIAVTFILSDGTEKVVEASDGLTLMQVATENGFDEILAECGGAGACATCHCYLSDAGFSKVGPANATEQEMLTLVAEPKPTSRLSCQINITPELNGLVVTLPESQY